MQRPVPPAPRATTAPEPLPTATGRLRWFSLERQFGFVALDGGTDDAFLHVAVLKAAGFVSVPVGSTLRVRLDPASGRRRIAEVLDVDVSTGLPGQPPTVLRKRSGRPC